MARKKSVTTFDIAERLGLAQSTVANVLNRSRGPKYAEKTRTRIFSAAEEMGYYTVILRRAIKTSLRQLGFLVSNKSELDSTFMRPMVNGVYKAAMQNGYSLMLLESEWKLGDVEDAKEKARKLVGLVESRVLDGILVDKSNFDTEQMRIFKAAKVPFVCINSAPLDEPVHHQSYWVCIDHVEGAKLATEYLLKCGHRHIAMISSSVSKYPVDWLPNYIQMRLKGYKIAMEAAGIEVPSEYIVEGSVSERETVYRAIDKLSCLPHRPTAIFAADDSIAILAMNHLRNCGFCIPDDFSIVGYGNWQVSFLAEPDLTTVSVPWGEMGRYGTEMLLDIIGKADVKEHVITLCTTMKAGDTVRTIDA